MQCLFILKNKHDVIRFGAQAKPCGTCDHIHEYFVIVAIVHSHPFAGTAADKHQLHAPVAEHSIACGIFDVTAGCRLQAIEFQQRLIGNVPDVLTFFFLTGGAGNRQG